MNRRGNLASAPRGRRLAIGIRAMCLGVILAFPARAKPPPGPMTSFSATAPGDPASAPFFIGEALLIDVPGGRVLRMDARISSEEGSREPLIKEGAGELHLEGDNDYEGETLLRAGTLRLAGPHPLGARMLRVYPGTDLAYEPGVFIRNGLQFEDAAAEPAPAARWSVSSAEATHAGLLQGTADFEKAGAGRLRLAGDALAYYGTVQVREGALSVEQFMSGAVRVHRGAVLEGAGSVGSAVLHAGGILSPGGPVGTLDIVGDLLLEPGSWLHVDVQPDGRSDRVRVGGTAILGGHVLARAQDGDWRPSTDYTILESQGGLAGSRFESVQIDLPFLDPVLKHEEHAVILTLVRNDTPLEELAETPAARDVAKELDDERGPLYEQVIAQDRAGAADSLSRLSGSWGASVQSMLMEDSRFIREAVHARAMGASSNAPWAHFFHSAAERRDENAVPGDERRISGLLLGARRPLGTHWSAGVLLGMDHSSFGRDAGAAHAGVNGVHAGIDVLGVWDDWRLSAGAAWSHHRIRSTRAVGSGAAGTLLQAHYRSRTGQLFAELSRTGPVQPFARFAWVRNHSSPYTEEGGPAALDVATARAEVRYTMLGLRLAATVPAAAGPVALHAQIGWRHAGGDTRVKTRQFFSRSPRKTLFESAGLPLATRAWSLELGADAVLSARARLGVSYAGQFSSGRQDHGLRVGLGLDF